MALGEYTTDTVLGAVDHAVSGIGDDRQTVTTAGTRVAPWRHPGSICCDCP